MKIIVIGGGPSRNDGSNSCKTKWTSSDFVRKNENTGKKIINNR